MKIGIIGVGYAGQLHSKAIEMLDSNIEYYVYDVTIDAAKEFARKHKCQAVETLDELYENVDAVIIATPTFTHYNLAMEAMEKGKHVLCEKPMSFQVEEAEKMLDMCKKNNLICMIGFNYRFFDITEILKKQNQIGEVNRINILIKRLFRNEWHNKENGVLSDLGIHLIDYLTYLCNQRINLNSCKVSRKYIEEWDYDSNVSGKTEKGLFFELTASRTDNPDEVQFSVELIGSKGIFKYDSRLENTYQIEHNNISHSYNFVKERETEDFFDFIDSITRQDEAWIEAILCGNVEKIATFEDGVWAQKALNYFLSQKDND